MSKIEATVQTPNEAKKEAFFSELEKKGPYERILCSVFKENTIAESWHLDPLGGSISGKIHEKIHEGENSPGMLLSTWGGYGDRRRGKVGLYLQISSKKFSERRFGQVIDYGYSEDAVFYIRERVIEDKTGTYIQIYDLIEETFSRHFSLSSGYCRWLKSIEFEIASKAFQIPPEEKIKDPYEELPKGEGNAGRAGPRPKELGM